MTVNVKNSEAKATDLRKNKPPFGMFVVLRDGVISWYPGQTRVWYYRGDNFTSDENKMLPSLINILVSKGIDKFKIVMIYDESFAQDNPKRNVVVIKDIVVEINELKYYRKMLQKTILPDYLK